MWDAISPFECRVIARIKRSPIRLATLAKLSNLSTQRIQHISSLSSWGTVPIGEASRFRIACGISPSNESRQIAFLKRSLKSKHGGLSHINKLPKRDIRRLFKTLRQQGSKRVAAR